MINRDQKINLYIYDDISFTVTLINSLLETLNMSFKEFSGIVDQNDLKELLEDAECLHCLPYNEAVNSISLQFFNKRIDNKLSYSVSELETLKLKEILCTECKSKNKKEFEEMYEIFLNGKADNLMR